MHVTREWSDEDFAEVRVWVDAKGMFENQVSTLLGYPMPGQPYPRWEHLTTVERVEWWLVAIKEQRSTP